MKKTSLLILLLFLGITSGQVRAPLYNSGNHFSSSAQPAFTKSMATADSNVTLIGRWANGPCFTTNVQGHYLFSGNGGAMDIFDISDPAQPSHLGQFVTPGIVMKIFATEQYVYIADDAAGLRIVDISDPANPQEVGFFDTLRFAKDVYVSDG